ncbi:hypothetical protein AXG93_3918s1020 [Marchantia polymorpha subsp. ruderalis]|uniref:Reverse transcriptase Ty1/copia-type domain-containing protein n=1 Tax=Marchantia polymorpha subsp. ruderalis TaxID=1480154 RepID=A0A176WI19_MARPO|nr:hypothetical protein AXG93_3918s1020 [Marchantia polymorpha subsp. ruderalis]
MFNMDHANALSAPMIGRSKTDDDPYRPAEAEEEELDKPKYLAAVGALLYLATNTRSDISFDISVLARHSQRPTARHWQGIKHLLSSRSTVRTMQTAISEMAGFPFQEKPTTIFDYNAACIEQVSFGFIKSDRVKHINPHLFSYTQDLTETSQIAVRKIASTENIADILTRALPAPQH